MAIVNKFLFNPFFLFKEKNKNAQFLLVNSGS